jgi:hypothetical protein
MERKKGLRRKAEEKRAEGRWKTNKYIQVKVQK